MTISSTVRTSTIIVSLIALGHFLLGLGIGWEIGPVVYDPETLLVRGSPATLEPGLERLFPKVLGCIYVSFGMGLVYSLLVVVPSDQAATRTALVPLLCYHSGAALDALRGTNAAAMNAEKMDPNEPLVGHALFLTLSAVAFVLSGQEEKSGDKKD